MTSSEPRNGSRWHPIPILPRFICMSEETKQKGSDQPPTKVGYDDERSKTGEKKGGETKKGSPTTDKVMEDQSKDHQVQRT